LGQLARSTKAWRALAAVTFDGFDVGKEGIHLGEEICEWCAVVDGVAEFARELADEREAIGLAGAFELMEEGLKFGDLAGGVKIAQAGDVGGKARDKEGEDIPDVRMIRQNAAVRFHGQSPR
jgi:hypothetical protein